MIQSKRAKRMARHHDRARRSGKLNLISLMDIFTILVFFLLVNSSEVEVLPSTKSIQMPESIAEQKPRETVVILVTDEDVIVQGEVVAQVAELSESGPMIIEPLREALMAQNRRLIKSGGANSAANREVTIMGDKEIPYRVLKKIMATCTQAEFGRISLAVMQKGADAPA